MGGNLLVMLKNIGEGQNRLCRIGGFSGGQPNRKQGDTDEGGEMNNWIVPIKKLITSKRTGDWCKLPYPNHPKGCPNYGMSKRCPPQAPMVDEYFDLSKPLYFIHSEFDFTAHVKKMRMKHPEWSDRQCQCVLYWQGTSRKQMKERVAKAVWELGTTASTSCPEAMGVNVYATAKLNGLNLDRIRHLKTCRHITLIGSKSLPHPTKSALVVDENEGKSKAR